MKTSQVPLGRVELLNRSASLISGCATSGWYLWGVMRPPTTAGPERLPSPAAEVQIQNDLGCRNMSRGRRHEAPHGWQMRHASRFIFGITLPAAVQFRWRGPCARVASRLGSIIFG